LITYNDAVAEAFSKLEQVVAAGNFSVASKQAQNLADTASTFKDSDGFLSAKIMEQTLNVLDGLESPTSDKKFVASVAQEAATLIKTVKVELTSSRPDKTELYIALRDLRWIGPKTLDKRRQFASERRSSPGRVTLEGPRD